VESQGTLKNANEDLLDEVRLARDRVRDEIQVQQKVLSEAFAQQSDHAMETLRHRLEDLMQSSLENIVAKVREQSEEYLETLARSTEQRLHEIHNQTFTEIAERLRERLLELGSPRKNDDTTSASAGL
jgi:arginine utilization protein RocB